MNPVNFIIFFLLVSVTQAAHNCTSFNDKNHGYGCELRNVTSKTEELEINVMSKYDGNNKTEKDVIWVQIRDSKLSNLPKGVFEKFVNMEKIMIIASQGFQNLDISYFDKKIKLILMKNTDLEIVGENAFTGLEDLQTLSLNYNNIKKIHKFALRDLVKVEKIEMVFNNIESFDDETFARNVNLKLVLMYNNKIKVLNSQLFGRNSNLESLQLQNNAISQIEKGFNQNLKSLTRLDLSGNICISENIQTSRYVQWSSHQYKFKDCFNNFAVIKPTNDDIKRVETAVENLETKVVVIGDKVSKDMDILEGKMINSTALDDIKSNLIDFFQNDSENLKKNFDNELNNITSHVRTDMMEAIEKKIERILIPQQDAKQEKLVSDDFGRLREELDSEVRKIYLFFFALICFAVATTFFVFHKLNIIHLPISGSYNKRSERQLIDPEN